MKGIVICILAAFTVVVSVIFQPWAELGFCLDPKDITTVSLLAGPLHWLSDQYSAFGLKDLGLKLQGQTVDDLTEEAKQNGVKPDPDWKNPVLSGDYAYVYFMSFSLVAAAIAIILIGREDAEEKTVLPVKK